MITNNAHLTYKPNEFFTHSIFFGVNLRTQLSRVESPSWLNDFFSRETFRGVAWQKDDVRRGRGENLLFIEKVETICYSLANWRGPRYLAQNSNRFWYLIQNSNIFWYLIQNSIRCALSSRKSPKPPGKQCHQIVGIADSAVYNGCSWYHEGTCSYATSLSSLWRPACPTVDWWHPVYSGPSSFYVLVSPISFCGEAGKDLGLLKTCTTAEGSYNCWRFVKLWKARTTSEGSYNCWRVQILVAADKQVLELGVLYLEDASRRTTYNVTKV